MTSKARPVPAKAAPNVGGGRNSAQMSPNSPGRPPPSAPTMQPAGPRRPPPPGAGGPPPRPSAPLHDLQQTTSTAADDAMFLDYERELRSAFETIQTSIEQLRVNEPLSPESTRGVEQAFSTVQMSLAAMRLRMKGDVLVKEIWESKLEHFGTMRKDMRKEYAELKLSVDRMSLFLAAGGGSASGNAVSVRGLYEERYGERGGAGEYGYGRAGGDRELQKRVSEQTREMADGVAILQQSNRQLAESEDVAIETLSNLHAQRETIEHSRFGMRSVGTELERAGGLVVGMMRRNTHRKREIYIFLTAIGALLLLLLVMTTDQANLAVMAAVGVLVLGLLWWSCVGRKRWRAWRGATREAEFTARLMGNGAVGDVRNWVRPGE